MQRRIDFTSYKTIFFAALLIRLIAAIFSQGYGMHDDHFLIIEASSSWSDGFDYNNWLPWSENNRGAPEGHSFTYVGLNYIYFICMKALGVMDPKILMLINRLIHAVFSLLILHFSYKITQRLGTQKQAITVGWIIAFLWVLPFLSVRNLVEITCIPFMLWGMWLTIKNPTSRNFLIAGLLLGFAVSIRYQVGVFAVGMAAVYFFKKEFKGFIFFCLGVLLMFALTQGLVDYLIWGKPFAEFLGYAIYNANEGTEYIPNNNYFMYFLVLMGLFLAPLGLLVGLGFIRGWKKYLILFLPVLFFLLFHSFYPSKQERFILPVFPFFLILGILGYEQLKQRQFWNDAWKFSYRAFWVINLPLLIFATMMYSKKSRIEAMYYFYGMNTEKVLVLQEATGETEISILPKFYCGNWKLGVIPRENKEEILTVHEGYIYDYILFCGEENLPERIDAYKASLYPNMACVKKCAPSFVDSFLRWLNPRNRNEYIEIWKTNIR